MSLTRVQTFIFIIKGTCPNKTALQNLNFCKISQCKSTKQSLIVVLKIKPAEFIGIIHSYSLCNRQFINQEAILKAKRLFRFHPIQL